MIINANTKISKILKHNEAALEAIISITPKFEKLRNPLLRKLMAGRTSIAMASKISGCSVNDFFEKLQPLGFEANTHILPDETEFTTALPSFMKSLETQNITELDVRPIIESGNDPLSHILEKVKTIQPGGTLKIINSFAPTPLIKVLEKKGFESYIQTSGPDYVESYFHLQPHHQHKMETSKAEGNSEDWESMITKYAGKTKTIDVRDLEMPQPMLTILSTLEEIEDSTALFVYHKRIPVFLLPELKEKGYDIRINTINDQQVHLLIFKN